MKRASEIMLLILTVIIGVSLGVSIAYVLLSALLEAVSIVFTCLGDIAANALIGLLVPEASADAQEKIQIIKNIILIIGSVAALITLSINMVISLLTFSLDVAIFVLFLVGTLRVYKAKKKSDVMLGAIIALIYGGIQFLSQSYLFAALGIAPGVMLLLLREKDFAPKVANAKDVESKEVKEQATPIEPEVVVG